jgi:hypothetical protein
VIAALSLVSGVCVLDADWPLPKIAAEPLLMADRMAISVARSVRIEVRRTLQVQAGHDLAGQILAPQDGHLVMDEAGVREHALGRQRLNVVDLRVMRIDEKIELDLVERLEMGGHQSGKSRAQHDEGEDEIAPPPQHVQNVRNGIRTGRGRRWGKIFNECHWGLPISGPSAL